MLRRFILAPDSFKGTMSAREICQIQEKEILRLIPNAVVRCVPIADGGEGLTDSYLAIIGGKKLSASVASPDGSCITACFGMLPDSCAVVEMAAAAGLTLVQGKNDIMRATTRGVGELMLAAKEAGAKKILLGLGGSATHDCGIGMAAALGYRFLDSSGAELEPFACNMGRVERILPPAQPFSLPVEAACDVDNPLFGSDGAVYTFGSQKGANSAIAAELDAGAKHLSEVFARELGANVANAAGAGAAGGLGAGVLAFLGGTLRPGIELLLDACNFDGMLDDADVVFTGEGRMDWQSAHGKAPVGVARRALAKNVPCVALCGSVGKNAEAVYEHGITAIFTAVNSPADFESVKATCREDMRSLTASVVRLLLSFSD